jgi:hypothetical protein
MGALFRDPLKRSALLLALLAELPVSTLAGDAFVVEWQAPSPERPWLSKLEVLPYSKNAALETEKLPASAQFPNGLRAKLSKQGLDALAQDKSDEKQRKLPHTLLVWLFASPLSKTSCLSAMLS